MKITTTGIYLAKEVFRFAVWLIGAMLKKGNNFEVPTNNVEKAIVMGNYPFWILRKRFVSSRNRKKGHEKYS